MGKLFGYRQDDEEDEIGRIEAILNLSRFLILIQYTPYSGVSSAIHVLEKKIDNQQELKNIIARITRKILLVLNAKTRLAPFILFHIARKNEFN